MRRMNVRGLVAAMEQEEVLEQANNDAAQAVAAAAAQAAEIVADGGTPVVSDAAPAGEAAPAVAEGAGENAPVEIPPVVDTPAPVAEVPAEAAAAAEAAPAAEAAEVPAAEVPAADPLIPPTDGLVAETPAETPAAEVAAADAAADAAAEAPAGEGEAAAVVDAVSEEAPEIGDNAESLETDLIEIADAEADAADTQDKTDDAVEVVEALESIAIALESAAGNGGMNKDSALAMGIALECMYKRVGVNVNRAMPSLESFGGTSSRVAATTLAMEDVKEKAKELWAKIVEAVKRSIAWLKQRFELIFGGAGKLQARAQALAKAAEATKGTAKAATIENERLVNALYINGKVDGVAAADLLKDMTSHVLKDDATVATQLAKVLESGKLVGIKELLGSLEGSFGVVQDVAGPASQGLQVPANSLKVQRSRELPGGKAILAHVADKNTVGGSIDDQVAAVAATNVFVGAGFPKVAAPAKADLKTLAPADVAKIAADVAAIAAGVQGYKVGLAKVTDAKNSIAASLTKLANSTDADPEVVREHKLLAKVGSAASRLIDVPVAGYSVYALNTAKALLDYAELSLKEYGAAEAAPAAAAAPAA